MRVGRLLALLVGAGAVAPVDGAAQERPAAGLGLLLVASNPVAAGFLARAHWSLAREVGFTIGAGLVRSGGGLAGRGEVALQFRFGAAGSGSRARPAWYVLGGLAADTRPRRAGWLMAGAGVELPSGRSASWWAEVGVAGGFRVAAGYQVAVGGRKR